MSYNEDVNVRLNVLSGALGGITAVTAGMSALTSTFSAFGTGAAEQFGALDGLLVSSAALLGTFAYQAAEAFGEFEQGMKIVQTVSGDTGGAIQQLSNQANQLSVEYRVAIGDITDGLQTLGRAGLDSANSQTELLRSGLQTAKLEGRELNTVLEEILQNTTMLGGDLKSANFGEQASYLNSLMVSTSMAAPIDSHDISQTMQYSGGTVAAAGGDIETPEGRKLIEDYMGTIAAFAQRGVVGSVAGTALRAFFTKPAGQDPSVTNALSTIGLTPEDLWSKDGESMKKISDQIEIIRTHMQDRNLSTMDQVQLWGKIVGPKMGQQMMKLDDRDIKDITQDIENSQTTEELVNGTLQTYNQKVAEMQQQGQVAFREFGAKAALFLKPVVEVITKILELLSNPVINLGAFAAFISLMIRGIKAGINMVLSLKSTIKAAIDEAMLGLKNLNLQTNELMGDSVSKSATISGSIGKQTSQVELYNDRLRQSNSILAQHQAQMLGLRNSGFMMPGGSTSEKIKPHVLQAWPKDTVNLSGLNKYYEPGEIDRGIVNDEIKQLSEFSRYMVELGMNPTKKFTLNDRKDATLLDIYKNELNNEFSPYKDMDPKDFYSLELEEMLKGTDISNIVDSYRGDVKKDFPITDDEIKAAAKEGGKKLRMTWEMVNEDYYEALKQKLEIDALNNNDPLAEYSLKRYKELEEQHGGKMYKTSRDGENYALIPRYEKIENMTSEGRNLLQTSDGFNKYFDDFERIKEEQIQAMRGTNTYWKKLQQDGEQSFQSMSNSANQLSDSLARFANKIPGTSLMFEDKFKKLASSSLDDMSDFFKDNKGLSQKDLAREALYNAHKETGLSGEKLAQVTSENDVFMNKLINKLGIEDDPAAQKQLKEDVNALLEHTAAVRSDTAATNADATSKTTSTLREKLSNGIDSLKGNFKDGIGQGLKNIFSGGASGLSSGLKGIGSKVAGGLKGGLSALTGLLGGPIGVAMTGVTAAMEVWSHVQQEYQKTIQEKMEKINDAVEKRNSAEDKVIDNFSKTHSGSVSDDEKEDVLLDAYSQIFDYEQDNHVKLDENTNALKEATYAYQSTVDKSVDLQNSAIGGRNSVSTTLSDAFGTIGQNNDYFNNGIILSPSQRSEDYQYSKEFAPIFADDVRAASRNIYDNSQYNKGNDIYTTKGVAKQMFGDDLDEITSVVKDIYNEMDEEKAWEKTAFGAIGRGIKDNFKTDKDRNRLQFSLRDDKEDYQRLGKLTRQFEKDHGGKSFYNYFGDLRKTLGKGQGRKLATDKSTYNFLAKHGDKNTKKIVSFLKNLGLKTSLNAQQILLANQLQQLQDMNQIASSVIEPSLMNQVALATAQYSLTGGMAKTEGSIYGATNSTAANAAAIAALLNAKVRAELKDALYTEGQDEGITNGKDKDQFYTDLKDAYDKNKNSKEGKFFEQHYLKPYADIAISQYGLSGTDLDNHVSDYMKFFKDYSYSSNSAIKSIGDRLNNALKTQIDTQYALSDLPDGSSGNSGGGGGGSGGGGSGGSDNSGSGGTRKERVDLVLCNKKEIPKLNVNLFKKPPNFTVLNKNFKLRDIKINSQDKPKSIMNAVKNGIIETQKRMDPKIIQDETAEYNPVEATDGTSTPSGTTRTTT